MAAPPLHTPEEAADLLRCTASWLKERARRRDIPFTLLGGAYRFTDDHLNWIVKRFEQQPDATGTTRAAPRRRTTPGTPPTGVTQLRARPPRRRAS